MNKKIKLIAIVLSLVLSLVILGGCGKTSSTDITANTVKASTVFVTPGDDNGDIAFFGYKNYLCTALVNGSTISEFTIEAAMTDEIYSLAVYDSNLYVMLKSGLYKYALADLTGSGVVQPVTISSNANCVYRFEIYGDRVYYVAGGDLCRSDLDGANTESLANDVTDFEITDDGAYFTGKDEAMHLLTTSENSKNDTTLETIDAKDEFIIAGATAYYIDSNNSIAAYDLKSGTIEKVETDAHPSMYSSIRTDLTNLIYDASNKARIKPLAGGEESECDGITTVYGKRYGTLIDGILYEAVSTGSGSFFTIDTAGLKSTEYRLADELAGYLSQIDNSNKSETATTGNSGGAASYDIMKNFSITHGENQVLLYFNDFMLVLPDNDNWSYEQLNNNSVEIYQISARQSGYTGNLVTIKAFDMNDTSYKELPNYKEAGVGKNTNVRFIAIYPTDVPYDTSNSTQKAAYQELSDRLAKIGEYGGPFATADGD